MPRIIPPWLATIRKDKSVVRLGDREFAVDVSRPPAFFFPSYLHARLPSGWLHSQKEHPKSQRHPLATWLGEFEDFLSGFEELQDPGSYRRILTPEAIALTITAFDLYFLDDNRKLQDSLITRLIDPLGFQGALYEVSVAATMIRADFRIEFEDESDSSRKHPEFVATHRKSGIQVAVEAKSKHRKGFLGAQLGNPPPSVEDASGHKIAAEVCGLVKDSLPKAMGRPLYVFVDLNLPPKVVEAHASSIQRELKSILPQVDTGFSDHGILTGKKMNFLIVTNRPATFGMPAHSLGDTLTIFVNPPPEDCEFPEGSQPIDDVKEALKHYGTIRG